MLETQTLTQRLFKKMGRVINKMGSSKKCYICNNTFSHFQKLGRGSIDTPPFLKMVKMVGSDTDNYLCLCCLSNDRERHLFMYFDKLKIWDKMKGADICHFAPEWKLREKILAQNPNQYLEVDFEAPLAKSLRLNAEALPFQDESLDFIMANHVLEHVPDYLKALSEFFRVLKPEGLAILQTPFSQLLKNNFKDDSINNDALRLEFYGQEDHVICFAEQELLNSMKETGFQLKIQKHNELFSPSDSQLYGVNSNEDLIYVTKTKAPE